MKMKIKAAEHNLNIPIISNQNTFQNTRNKKVRIKDLEIAGIYRIKFKDENEKEGITKSKIKERIQD